MSCVASGRKERYGFETGELYVRGHHTTTTPKDLEIQIIQVIMRETYQMTSNMEGDNKKNDVVQCPALN